MKRCKRRFNTSKKIKQRERLISIFGTKGGLIYERHCEKINKSKGYMRDGNVTHYVRCGFGEKTRDRNRYGKVLRLCHSDAQKIDEIRQQISELDEGI